MHNMYMTNIKINSVRRLNNVNIPLSINEKKHLIITGKNGSGKTSLLEAMSKYLVSVADDKQFDEYPIYLKKCQENLLTAQQQNNQEEIKRFQDSIKGWKDDIKRTRNGLDIHFNESIKNIYEQFHAGKFILAYYSADRIFKTEEVQNVEKINLKDTYLMNEKPSEKFLKYLVDIKVTQALALANHKEEKANQIEKWFQRLENLLREIFDNNSLRLVFDEDRFHFDIQIDNKITFDFNTLSSGYAAILNIVVDLIMRMEKNNSQRGFEYTIPGIVLIDEIETHLHIELQKNIMKLLTTIFPHIQFIVTTHSPFILNSLEDVVIYDLENKTLVEEGLSNVPYEGIVEGYFNADLLSQKLKDKFDRYKELTTKQKLNDEEFIEIAHLEMYLEEIPDYLALDLTTQYQALKLAFERRNDLQ